MPRLQALRPKIGTVPGRLQVAASTVSKRLRGRAAVERRARWLTEHPLCDECERQGRLCAAVTPDHIVPLHLGGADDDSNLQSLCEPCHQAKTNAEATARAQGTSCVA